jgi:N-acyl-D-amino-acid deacylase
MEGYLDKITSQGVSFNVVALVDHGTVRQNVMGFDDREPSQSELGDMKQLVDEAMSQGAWGMSTGLIYPPSVYAGEAELVGLSKIVAKHGGIYASHVRGEGENLLNAIKEALQIGERGGVPVQLAHFKASGKPYWGMIREALTLLEEARDRGVDVTFDQYPYIASSTGLTALLLHWAHEGGAERLIERLNDAEIREEMLKYVQITRDWDTILIVNSENHPDYVGKTLRDIARSQSQDPFDTMCALLIEEETRVPVVIFGMGEEDVRRAMRNPLGMVGSDGSAIYPEDSLARGNPTLDTMEHSPEFLDTMSGKA